MVSMDEAEFWLLDVVVEGRVHLDWLLLEELDVALNRPGHGLDPDALLDLVDPLLEPLRHETFSFSRPWLRSQTARFSDPRYSASRAQRKLNIPVRNLLVQRVIAGTTGVLCLLGARVPLRHEAAMWLPELAAPSAR